MSDIEQILYPTVLYSLHEDIPPVKCIIWNGDDYETITFDKVYPFDTIDDIKRMICTHYKDNAFIPRFMFVGVPQDTKNTTYIPADYLWYPNGTNDPKLTYILKNPRKLESDLRFVSSDGSWASPNIEPRGRSSIEQVFLRDGPIPVFHVFTLASLLKRYKGPLPISEDDWNKRFAPYFPDIKVEGPYKPDSSDVEFAQKIHFFIEQREKSINKLNRYLMEGVEVPIMKLTGIRQLRLTWKKQVQGFEGCGYMFYRLHVTEKRPYLRLLPSEGTPISKIHIKGVLPIPSLEDPKVLEQWTKEISPTPRFDCCSMKYVHRTSIGITPPIYGTIQIFNDGTINLLLLPPKQLRKLDPNLDFRNFNTILNDVFEGLPQPSNNFELREIAALFTIKTSVKSKKFSKLRIQQRLPYFQTFFHEIKPLPDETPIISLRYKAVSQYASEDKTFTFLTQFSTSRMLKGDSDNIDLITALQNEFQLSKQEAISIITKWHEQKGIFTVQIPDDGEFIESFNPGIDIHIYAQHPSYYFHVNRIDSHKTYIRIYTLLSLLFVEDDEYFKGISLVRSSEIESVSSEIENDGLKNEPSQVNKQTVSHIPGWIADDPTANVQNDQLNDLQNDPFLQNDLQNDPFADPDMNDAIKGNIIKGDTLDPVVEKKEEKKEKKEQKEQKEQKEKKKEDDEQKLVNPKSWFIKKLQEIDPRLFSYKTEDTDDNGYSRKCAGYDDRQPSILSKDQYERMREIYEEDPIFWITYPLEGTDEPIQPLGTEETVSVMKYGSDQESINYYFCPQYYCLSDEIMVRPTDFEATSDRNGNKKPPNTCPFCYGKLITDKKKGIYGYTVIKRKDKKGATYHSYIDFMSKTTHPEGFALPCCFLKQTTLRISDPQYSHLRAFLQENDEDEVEDEYKELIFRGEAIEYAVLFETLYKKYILESNKHPDAGIFATVSSKFDKYFRQNSIENIITRVAIHLKLRPNAQGFLRIGTENTIYESIFGVIAPLLYKNSINEVRQLILQVINPRIFLNSHFGNLVLEFYNPTDARAMPRTKDELRLWASDELGIGINSTNMYALIRVYNAYKRFIHFINDPTQRKDLRHIQPILAEPNILSVRGIQLIVMEDNGDEPVTIKCPIFGVSMDRNKNNDFAFISRTLKNIGSTDNKYARYELYLHTSNRPAKGGEQDIHETIIRWDYASQKFWPDIVRTRIDEYMTQCQSRYRSIYTSQDKINSMAMIPLSRAVDSSPIRPEGIIKDSYNHIVGLTFRFSGSSALVTLPIVDDGVISISSAFSIKSIYLDWDDFKPAPVDEIIKYYKKNFEPLFGLYPGYKIKYIVKRKEDNTIIALQLTNGIYIPAVSPKDPTAVELEVVPVEQFEWSINKEIAGIKSGDFTNVLDNIEKGCGVDTELVSKSYNEFEELYQQFRLIVSNWITSHKAGSEIRKGIEDIIFNPNLPDYEKRKRLYLFISSVFLSWFHTGEKRETPSSFLRKDCRVIDNPGDCTGTCFWKKDVGKCSLHVDAITKLGEVDVSTPELFTNRIIDELVRFPIRRKQLMAREISKVSTIIQPIRQGDQYIIPESSPTWTNLLRLDWSRQIPEESKYYEEMSREPTAANEQPLQGELPAELESILGKSFHLLTYNSLDAFERILGLTLDQLDVENNIFTKDNLVRYVKYTSKPIGMINIIDNDIQFVRPDIGVFHSILIFVFLPDMTGLLMEEQGNPYVNIASLPQTLQELYYKSKLVKLKTEEYIEPKMPIIIGQNPIMTKKKRIPLAASKISKPLKVKSPKSKSPRSRSKRRLRASKLK